MAERTNSFKQKHIEELKLIIKQINDQLRQDVIPFWETRSEDKQHGGYFHFFDRKGKRYDDCKAGWFVGRTMYTFSSMYNEVSPDAKYLEIARVGREYFNSSFYAGAGRFNRMMSTDGEIIEGTTSIFTDHFAVKGLYEYIMACQEERLDKDVKDAEMYSEILFANVKNPEIRKGVEPPRFQTHALNFMNLQVAQKSRGIFGERYQHIIDECVKRSLYTFVDDKIKAPLEYIGLNDLPCFEDYGRIIDPGHTMEALWFCLEEGNYSNNMSYARRAGEILDWVIERCYDEKCGGFYHRVDVDGGAPKAGFSDVDYGPAIAAWDDKVWWVQSEALLALGMSALINENEKHYQYFQKQLAYTENYFRDYQYGEWYAILHRDGRVKCDLKGFAGKGAYHVPRCLIHLIHFLESYV